MPDASNELAVVLRLVRRQAEHVATHADWPDYAREHPAVSEELAWVQSIISSLEGTAPDDDARERLREADSALDSASRLMAGLRAYARAREMLARRHASSGV